MPVIRGIDLKLDFRNVLRRQGMSGHPRLDPKVRKTIDDLLQKLSTMHLLQPAVAYEIYKVEAITPDYVQLQGETVVQGSIFSSYVQEGERIAAAVCTIGSRLEELSRDYFAAKEPVRGLLLDGIGSAAVDSLVQEACRIISRQAISEGYQCSSPASPGMPGFPLTEQAEILRLAHGSEIGVKLTSSGVMQPLKSVSMIIGMGQNVKRYSAAEVCARCNMRYTCRHRIHAQ